MMHTLCKDFRHAVHLLSVYKHNWNMNFSIWDNSVLILSTQVEYIVWWGWLSTHDGPLSLFYFCTYHLFILFINDRLTFTNLLAFLYDKLSYRICRYEHSFNGILDEFSIPTCYICQVTFMRCDRIIHRYTVTRY